MKKKILIILAIISITLIAVLYFSFGKQYKAASSVHLVSDGMYMIDGEEWQGYEMEVVVN